MKYEGIIEMCIAMVPLSCLSVAVGRVTVWQCSVAVSALRVVN